MFKHFSFDDLPFIIKAILIIAWIPFGIAYLIIYSIIKLLIKWISPSIHKKLFPPEKQKTPVKRNYRYLKLE